MSERVARSRELVARGGKPTVVARVLQISRQAIYRTPARRPAKARRQGPPVDRVDRAIVEVALDNQTDLPNGRSARRAQARPGGQPQAGAQVMREQL